MNRVIVAANKLDNAVGKTEAFVLIVSILAMAINTIANVFGRYVFSQSIYFSEELNEMLIISVTFFGLGYVTRQGRHIRMSAVYDALPLVAQKITMIFIAIVTAVVMFVLAWYAYEYLDKLASRGRITPVLQVPIYLTYVWVPIGFFITGIQYLMTAIRNSDFSEGKVFVSYTAEDEYEDPESAEYINAHKDEFK